MKFLDRTAEMQRLLALHNTKGGGLGLVWGRRRVGKTCLLVEWIRRMGGIYTVADQSAPAVQRRYFAEALSGSLAGPSEPEYPDWRTLLRALGRQAASTGRMWFRIVAPHRAALATGGSAIRSALWKRHAARLNAYAWEDLCRSAISHLPASAPGGAAPWGPAFRYWKGDGPEWDLVSASMEGEALLLGEAKWSERPLTGDMIEEAARVQLAKGIPSERWAHGKRGGERNSAVSWQRTGTPGTA